MIDADFRAKLVTLTELPVQEGVIDDGTRPPWVWYRRSAEETDLDLDGTPGLTTTTFDVEVVGPDLGQVQEEAGDIKGVMHGFMGLLAPDGTRSKGAYAEDHSDEYEPRSVGAAEGYHMATFSVRIIH